MKIQSSFGWTWYFLTYFTVLKTQQTKVLNVTIFKKHLSFLLTFCSDRLLEFIWPFVYYYIRIDNTIVSGRQADFVQNRNKFLFSWNVLFIPCESVAFWMYFSFWSYFVFHTKVYFVFHMKVLLFEEFSLMKNKFTLGHSYAPTHPIYLQNTKGYISYTLCSLPLLQSWF